MTVAGALLLDAYRQLNARKLFWLTLALSGVIMLGYLSIGFDETGMSMLFGLTHVESEFIREGSPIARILYRAIFSTFIVGMWLAWAATILALISTATIFPDMLAEGAVDLVLSKPVSRVRLFVLRYLTSLLFVFLQVGVFCVGVFVAMGWRLGEWNWLIFAAVPLITLFYSYLYSVTVLVGVVTRSALAALLLTILFWFSVFSVTAAEDIVKHVSVTAEVSAEEAREDGKIASAESSEKIVTQLDPWLGRVGALTAVLPKTGETIGLLDRWLKEDSDVNLLDILANNVELTESGTAAPREHNKEREVEQRLLEEMESRSWWWIIGSSLAFELVVLAVACFVFVRRDF